MKALQIRCPELASNNIYQIAFNFLSYIVDCIYIKNIYCSQSSYVIISGGIVDYDVSSWCFRVSNSGILEKNALKILKKCRHFSKPGKLFDWSRKLICQTIPKGVTIQMKALYEYIWIIVLCVQYMDSLVHSTFEWIFPQIFIYFFVQENCKNENIADKMATSNNIYLIASHFPALLRFEQNLECYGGLYIYLYGWTKAAIANC